jgi:lipopolysaccharide transport system ATP-binding protein
MRAGSVWSAPHTSEVKAVDVRGLSKNYPLSGSPSARLRRLFRPVSEFTDGLWALRDVSFSVKRGEAFGIIGANGSGKSTLLQMIAGILRPTSGVVEVNGRLSALLELGSGFSPEFTGRDNVYLNGSILGLTRREIDDRFETIERFAEIGDFIDQPIRTYSTGMVLRLAFAVSAHVDPEILIVDEALAVGDIAFRQRCMRRIHDLRARGTTILFVSHDTSDIKALCERCLWLQGGVVQELGEADDVVQQYLIATTRKEIAHAGAERIEAAAGVDTLESYMTQPSMTLEGSHRYGDRRAIIVGAELLGPGRRAARTLNPEDRVEIRVRFQVAARIDSLIAGFLVRNSKGENIFGSNTARENYPVPAMTTGQTHTVEFHWTMPELPAAIYTISLGLADGDIEHSVMSDYVDDAITFTLIASGERAAEHDGAERRGYFQLRCAAVSVHSHIADRT